MASSSIWDLRFGCGQSGVFVKNRIKLPRGSNSSYTFADKTLLNRPEGSLGEQGDIVEK